MTFLIHLFVHFSFFYHPLTLAKSLITSASIRKPGFLPCVWSTWLQGVSFEFKLSCEFCVMRKIWSDFYTQIEHFCNRSNYRYDGDVTWKKDTLSIYYIFYAIAITIIYFCNQNYVCAVKRGMGNMILINTYKYIHQFIWHKLFITELFSF